MLINNIGRLVTMVPGEGREGVLGVIENAAVRIGRGRISWVGSQGDIPAVEGDEGVIDAKGGVVLPGLVDCHTHIVHAGTRQHEFNLRSQGKSYREIAAAGGGIMSTVRATRGASFEDLYRSASERIGEATRRGATAVEIKTGYGLDPVAEKKMCDVIARLQQKNEADVFGTFLGAHIVPEEYKNRRGDYVRLVVDEMLPAVSASDAISGCDVFVEDIAFTKDEARAIAGAARNLGLALHLHVDQFSDGGGAKLAAELGAASASHLDYTNAAGMRAMAGAGVVAVVLPGASFFAGGGRYPDCRKMIDRGVDVAIATDYNPGTSPCLDLMLNASTAVTQTGMTCDEALLAITRNGAKALRLTDRGSISKGGRADLVVFDAPDEYYLLYRYGANFTRTVVIDGRVAAAGK